MKRYLLILSCIFFIFMVLSIDTFSQLNPEQEEEIDELFQYWDRPNHPGGSVGIMQDGKLLYAKAFGMASLEYKVPNTYGTIFNIASVSKQFTSMGILLLQKQGKLSIEDDIRKHLPELPDFGDPITLKQCMQHLSGMRSLHALLGMAGWRGDDTRTNEDLFRFMQKQTDLNFKPGDEFLYCNTGYMLLSRVIARVTEQEFPTWMKENVFIPLDMNHTYVEDDISRVVPNNATSYYGRRIGNFSRAIDYWEYVGSGNIHATTQDLLTWLENYHTPQTGWGDLFTGLQELGKLNSGQVMNYALGVNINTYKGEKWIGHGGSIGGFRANIMTFPEKKLNMVVLTNFSAGDPQGKIFSMFDNMMGEQMTTENSSHVEINSIALSAKKMKKFEGEYWNTKDNYSRRIYVKNDTLRYFRSEGNETKLLPIGQAKFQMMGLPFVATVEFEKAKGAGMNMIFRQGNEGIEELFESFTTPVVTKEMVSAFVGIYYSPELDTFYSIEQDGVSLKGYHSRHGNFDIELLRENYLEADLWVFSDIKVKRNKKKEVEGLYVSNGRARNVWFEKR